MPRTAGGFRNPRASLGIASRMTRLPIPCPACGGANDADAVFCANRACRKALGEFRYVAEELAERSRWHERVAERVVAFVGQGYFIVVHLGWFALWVAVNTGAVTLARPFDAYPFGLLGLAVGVEAILLTGFVLISQNRERAHADARAELDYEVSVRTHRRIEALEELLREVLEERHRHPRG
jgi:uncharacterized membrane protein